MPQMINALRLMFSAAALAAAVPTPTAAPAFNSASLHKRASCTFTDASAASASKKGCATIVLDNIAVPSGTTLDLTDLTSGTSVIFEGETTWGYEEWSGPLLSISGKNIAISGKSGHTLNGGGARWWDGKGTNAGGKTKPKFFYAHDLTGRSSITGLNILNTPVQAVSIDGASGLTITDMTIDDSAGDKDSLGHNTDAFDIGSSTSVTITGANVKNQDDCLAINSGSVSSGLARSSILFLTRYRASLLLEEPVLVAMDFLLAASEAVMITMCLTLTSHLPQSRTLKMVCESRVCIH